MYNLNMEDSIMLLLRNSNQVPGVFDHFFDGEWFDWANRNFSSTNTTLPSVNVKENTDQFTVEVAAPGFEKTDFKIEVNHNTLSISSEKKVESETKEGEQFTKREFSYQSFARSFTLPQIADGEKIEASYDKGILTVVIPKREEAKPKPSRMIEIN